MSCTSAKKTEQTGLPLLPGSTAWKKQEEKKRLERKIIDEAKYVIDDAPPAVNLRREINLHEMKVN